MPRPRRGATPPRPSTPSATGTATRPSAPPSWWTRAASGSSARATSSGARGANGTAESCPPSAFWRRNRAACCTIPPPEREGGGRGRVVDLPLVRETDGVPLSEDEQRILHEIERSFYENDPAFAKGVSQTTLYRHAGRNLKFSALGFVSGLVVLLVSFASSLVLGMIGFLAMLG